MSNVEIVGQRIKHYRKLKSLTQKELAAEVGVASSYIANIEQGQKGISLDKLVDICRCFDIGLSDLLPMETQSEADIKEQMIFEIVDTLRAWEPTQVKLLKIMVDGAPVGANLAEV